MTNWAEINKMNEQSLDLELKRLKVKEFSKLREFRQHYSFWLFWITIVWIVVILIVVIINGNTWGLKLIHLSDKIVIALITTTTINVFAFFVLVIKYVFSETSESKRTKV